MSLSLERKLGKALNLKGIPRQTMGRRPSGKIWPSDEFSFGYVPIAPDDAGGVPDFVYVAPGLGPDGQAWEPGQPLNLSDAPKSHKPSKRGLKGITSFGRNMLKSAGAIASKEYPQHRKTFCTITLPDMPQDDRRAVVKAWSEITRQLVQWVNRRIEPLGVPPLVFGCTEVQPRRLASTGEGYLHFHLMWLNIPARAGHWSIEPNDLRDWMASALVRIAGLESVGHVNVNVKPVEGSAASYMAKYLSKGAGQIAEALEDWGEDCCPSTWWFMNKATRDGVKSRIVSGPETGSILEIIVASGWETTPDDYFEFLRSIEVEFDGVAVTMGWRGRLIDSVAEDLRDMLKCRAISLVSRKKCRRYE